MGITSRLLLDSHALIWCLGDTKLSKAARKAVEEADEVYVSAATIWELAIKYNRGKLPSAKPIIFDLEYVLSELGFEKLSISMSHGQKAGLLPRIHNDPFDRMLIAQSLSENLAFVSNETLFDQYGVRRIW